ncbi:unnamed protein product [Urochloa humidicola]
MQREQEEARKEERRVCAENVNKAVTNRILDYDIKQGGEYYNRFYFADFSKFDLDEESPLGPMRYTDRVCDEYWPNTSVNILSVKIASLDVYWPIYVYGTVIARDSIDHKCIYLFRRDKDHCQLITSSDQSLILTGPKRGLALMGHVEIDLKMKNLLGQEEELSKGFLTIRGIAGRHFDKCDVESQDLATRLSTMVVTYAVVNDAAEATISKSPKENFLEKSLLAPPASRQLKPPVVLAGTARVTKRWEVENLWVLCFMIAMRLVRTAMVKVLSNFCVQLYLSLRRRIC